MTQLTENIYAVEVPKTPTPIYQYSLLSLPEHGLSWLHYLDENEIDLATATDLHGNQWSFICTSSGISESQAAEIVGYTLNDWFPANSALESFHSLLKSKGLNDGCWAILRKQ